jgi:ATP-dependent DNA helicase RecG
LKDQELLQLIKQGESETLEFRNISEGFMVTVFTDKTEVTEKVGEKVGENITKNQELILQFIKENNQVSATELAEKIGISRRKTEENIRKLKQKKLLRRMGPARGGHWEV